MKKKFILSAADVFVFGHGRRRRSR